MSQQTTMEKLQSARDQKKRKPVRRDPEKRRQQNIQAQRRYREKIRARLENLEALAASLAPGPQPAGAVEPESRLVDESILSLSKKGDMSTGHQHLTTVTVLDSCSSKGHSDYTDNTSPPLDVWNFTTLDYPSSSSQSDIFPLAPLIPAPEAFLSMSREWAQLTQVDPSILLPDIDPESFGQCWTTTTIECNCSSSHFQVQTLGPRPYKSTEVRILQTEPIPHVPSPYINHLRLDMMCTLAAMDTLRSHVGITEEMMCDDEYPSPFYRLIRNSAADSAQENVICSVQKIFKTLKPDLRPSREQITVQHPPYIDVLPFPTLRRNLIFRQQEINEEEFLRDAVTGLMCWGRAGVGQKDRDTSTGFASTGTPWDSRSWEAQAWFLKKYWSLLGGDEGELVRQSEWWRNMRGEDSLDLESAEPR